MFCSIKIYRCTPLLLCLVGLLVASGCTITGRVRNLFGIGTPPKAGIRITRVIEGEDAKRAGLQPMDLIAKYGDHEVVDDSSYFAALEAYATSNRRVQLEVWRGRQLLTPSVEPGRLGVETNEYNPAMYKFQSIMQRLDSRNEIPLYYRDQEFHDEFDTPPEQILQEARAVIDQAAQAGTITPTQALVARIYMILDDAPPAALKEQSELLQQFLSTQSDWYIQYMGRDVLFHKRRYRSAMVCFKQHLKAQPDDLSTRLNLGITYNEFGMFDEAEAAAEYVANNNSSSLSDYGTIVLYDVKAEAALGKHDYARSMVYANKVFDLHHELYEISIVMLAAAKAGDLKKLADANHKFERVLPDEYQHWRYQVDALEAYALVNVNQRDRARQLFLKWKDRDRIEGRISRWWGSLPGGDDVARNWRELAKN